MPTDDCKSRTHEPSLRELTADLDGAKAVLEARIEALREVVNERHQQYKERFEAQKTSIDSALAANKELTRSSFESSEKAISVASEAQKDYNEKTNELRGTLNDWVNRLMTTSAADIKFNSLAEKIEDYRGNVDKRLDEVRIEIAGLRESRSSVAGRETFASAEHQQRNWVIGTIVSLLIGVASMIVALVAVFHKP